MGNPPSRAFVVLSVVWKRLADISTAAWIWSFLPSGAISVIAGWRASLAGLPDWAVILVALGALALAMVCFVSWHSWRARTSPDQNLSFEQEIKRQEVKERARRAVKAKLEFERAKGETAAAIWATDHTRRAESWIPLHSALRYLVYESEWGHLQTMPTSETAFDRLVALEFRERLVRGDVRARGAKGGAFSNPDQPTEEIPAYYWQHGTIQPHAEIQMEDANRGAAWTTGSGDTYRRVLIASADLVRIWPKSANGDASSLASFVEPQRAFYASSKAAVPRLGEAGAMPDITFNELIGRILKLRGLEDDGSPEALAKIREIGREVGDQMSLRKLSTWARRGSTLEPLPFEISKKGVGVGRDASGGISHLLQYTDEDGNRHNVMDYRFLKAEIQEVWPDDRD